MKNNWLVYTLGIGKNQLKKNQMAPYALNYGSYKVNFRCNIIRTIHAPTTPTRQQVARQKKSYNSAQECCQGAYFTGPYTTRFDALFPVHIALRLCRRRHSAWSSRPSHPREKRTPEAQVRPVSHTRYVLYTNNIIQV